MKIPGNSTFFGHATGTAARVVLAPHSAEQRHPLTIGGLSGPFDERGRERRIPDSVKLYRDQIRRALFAVIALVVLSGCKTSPPPQTHGALGLGNTSGYSVIVIPVFIVRPSSSDNDADTPPWSNQTDPGTVPFKLPDHTPRVEEAHFSTPLPSRDSANAPDDFYFADSNKPKAGFTSVPSAGARAHSSTDDH